MARKSKLTRREFIKITAVAGSVMVGGKLLFDLLGDDAFATIRETRLLMGTIINLSVVAESSKAAETAVNATFAELERQISIFTHRKAESPVAILNRTGALDNPPKELVYLLDQANQISELTNGAFDIKIKPLLDLYQEYQPELPEVEKVLERLELVGYKKIAQSPESISFSQPNMAITLDGIAKGHIVDAGVAELNRLGFSSVFVEAGGDLMASGKKGSSNPWKVGVQSPRQQQSEIIANFSVTNQAVATSGDYIHYYSSDLKHHHILDSRTGFSPPELASATVIAPTCLLADALATALIILGKEKGLALIQSLPDVEALLIAKDMNQYRSENFIA